MKKCPYCAELNPNNAVICRHCGKNFKTVETPKNIEEIPPVEAILGPAADAGAPQEEQKRPTGLLVWLILNSVLYAAITLGMLYVFIFMGAIVFGKMDPEYLKGILPFRIADILIMVVFFGFWIKGWVGEWLYYARREYKRSRFHSFIPLIVLVITFVFIFIWGRELFALTVRSD